MQTDLQLRILKTNQIIAEKKVILSLCSLAGSVAVKYSTVGLSYWPPGWESIPRLLIRFTNTGSVRYAHSVRTQFLIYKYCTVQYVLI